MDVKVLGLSVSVSMPLDGGATELCKERARAEIARANAQAEKERLDFELVRLLRCGEAKRAGIHFHPDSPYAAICADVVVINNVPTVVPPRNETPVSQGQR